MASQIGTNEQAVSVLETELSEHAHHQATPTELGHVLQAKQPAAVTTEPLSDAPLFYDQDYLTEVKNRIEDLHHRLDDLITQLQTAKLMR